MESESIALGPADADALLSNTQISYRQEEWHLEKWWKWQEHHDNEEKLSVSGKTNIPQRFLKRTGCRMEIEREREGGR